MKFTLAVLFSWLVATAGWSQSVWRVDAQGGGDFTDIQPAVDVAGSGDVILVAGGEYSGFTALDLDLINTALAGAAQRPFGADKETFLAELETLRDLIGRLGEAETAIATAVAGSAAAGGEAGTDGAFEISGTDLAAASGDGSGAAAPAAQAAPAEAGAPADAAAAGDTGSIAGGSAGGDAGAAAGGGAAGAMGGGFWSWLLTSVERTVSTIDQITNLIDQYLDIPGLNERTEAMFESILEMLDDTLARLDGFLDVVDRWAPPRFDDWISDIKDRIQQERDDIDAILNPPAPVETPDEPDTPVVDTPDSGNDGGNEDQPEREWTADDFTGEGKTIVVIDTGWNSEFLGDDERPIDQFDFYSNDANAQVSTSNDHGSWVDQVVREVADGVETIHLKVFPDGGGGAPFSAIEAALDWVIDAVRDNSFDISAVNLSLGYGNTTSEAATGLSDEFAELDDLGIFSVVAAGNSGQYGVQYLAADENTIAVSASTSAQGIAGFSQHHETLTDIFAFGQSVRIEKETGGADVVSGTSFAAPYVSGVAARLQQAADELIERSLTDDEFIEIMQLSGLDLNGYTGSNDPAGYHVADADAALDYFIQNHDDYAALV